jgi:hypothetical protein
LAGTARRCTGAGPPADLELLTENALQEGHGLGPGDGGAERQRLLQHVAHVGPGPVHRRAQPRGAGPAQVLRIAVRVPRAPRLPGVGAAERGEEFKRQPQRLPDALQPRHGGHEPERVGRVDAHGAVSLQAPPAAHRLQGRPERHPGAAMLRQPRAEAHERGGMDGLPVGGELQPDPPAHVVQAGGDGRPVGQPLHELQQRERRQHHGVDLRPPHPRIVHALEVRPPLLHRRQDALAQQREGEHLRGALRATRKDNGQFHA